ncbi:U32 family peptidase [Paludisphaera rhizosphaerae]|uniref:U32 family peptidase n=1 Tax=Paludisphaera rhizosphaerae TaxID=2711216 RepID=UPI001F0D7872|nr:U32 family peptidase [Paludisphaera rhizosphaerae]
MSAAATGIEAGVAVGTGTVAGALARVKPELLAPAGDRECVRAAVANGADAIYFGLKRHNARIRASNFDGLDLSETMAFLRRHGVRGYVTLNTLIFPKELADVEATLRELNDAGVDAVIVQDLGLTRLIRAVAPNLEIHGSTQMSITSEEGVRLAAELGCSRVILARELSLDEVRRVRAESTIPVEVFVHGALCVAYSGQCLTSEALGGRSANRGECAQACRMPYQIVCDGEDVDLGKTQYLLSPQDLAAYDLVPDLIGAGVASLKIEGRLKSPEYVANITRHYRRAIDEAWEGRTVAFTPREVEDMEMSFSRGFSHGFLDGVDHKILVRGDYAKKRGVLLGEIHGLARAGVHLKAVTGIKPGDGLVFDGDEAMGVPEQGGRVYEVVPIAGRPDLVELRFGRGDMDFSRLHPGQRAWKTDDPELTARLRKTFEGPSPRQVGLAMKVRAAVGEPIRVEARTATGLVAEALGDAPLAAAQSRPADDALLREQLGRLGGTAYRLDDLEAEIEGAPMVPKSLLNQIRRDLTARLDALADAPPPRPMAAEPVLPGLLAPIRAEADRQLQERLADQPPRLVALCRRTDQIAAAAAAGASAIYADYQDIKEYKDAVAEARRVGLPIHVASPRIEKPAERNLFKALVKSGADGLLVRNAGGLAFCAETGVPFVADFSLNASNPLTVALFRERGAERVAASYDLDAGQLFDLIEATPTDWLEVVIHQQIPMFHMEHCVFCAFLSPGTDHTNCGRPCDHHDVKLRDRVGKEHPLKADVGCRNTLFNAVPQTAAEFLPRLIARGVRNLRVEFLDDSPETVSRTLTLYRETAAGLRDGRTLWRELKASNQYGVTRGPLAVLS